MVTSLKIIFDHFFTISVVFVFFFFENLKSFFFFFTILFYTNHENNHWVLTEESPRLTTMDDNNTLTVFEGYYTRSLFPLPDFLNGVAGIHQVLISLNEIMTLVLEYFLACIERDSLQ